MGFRMSSVGCRTQSSGCKVGVFAATCHPQSEESRRPGVLHHRLPRSSRADYRVYEQGSKEFRVRQGLGVRVQVLRFRAQG